MIQILHKNTQNNSNIPTVQTYILLTRKGATNRTITKYNYPHPNGENVLVSNHTFYSTMHSVTRRAFPSTTLNSVRCSKTVMRWLAIWGIIILVLLSIDVSTATQNPLHHPQSASHHFYNDSANNHASRDRNVRVVRGGSTILQPPKPPQQQQQEESSSRAVLEQPPMHYQQQQQQQQQQSNPPIVSSNSNNDDNSHMYFLPKVGLKQITKALLHTSEWNRRLLRGIKHWGKHERIQLVSSSSSSSTPSITYPDGLPNSNRRFQQPHQQLQETNNYQNYGSLPVNVHPSRSWLPPIEKDSGRTFEEEELTLFHAKIPNETQSWGPDLLPYLKHVAEVLDIDEESNGIELVLAMVYLDRACSVETPRRNGIAHCPFLQPRTVHRLGLAALVVAKSATDSNQPQDEVVAKLATSLRIPAAQLQQMVEWMVGALGDDGMYVDLEELKTWSKIWESFVSKTTK